MHYSVHKNINNINAAQNSACHHKNKLHFKMYSNKNSYFKLYYQLNKCNIGEQKVFYKKDVDWLHYKKYAFD